MLECPMELRDAASEENCLGNAEVMHVSKEQDWYALKHRKLIKLKLQQDTRLTLYPLQKSSDLSYDSFDYFASPTCQ